MTHSQKENYKRINDAILFIEENLTDSLLLETIAEKAHFSPFYFHRLFKIIMGETPNQYIHRKRIEKAASFLIHRKEKSIQEISDELGFSSLSSFSRSFKNFYNVSPSEFKDMSVEKFSKICKTKSKNGQVKITFEQYIRSIQQSLKWIEMNATTEVRQVEKLELAYVSHVGKMDFIGNAYDQLIKWAGPKGLMGQENLRMVTIYHDSPKITDPNHLRMSACMVLNNLVPVEGEVGLRTLDAGKCIVSRYEITPNQFQQAWESNFVWMAENGYKKGDKDPFEIYHNHYLDHPEKKFIVDLCIPIQ